MVAGSASALGEQACRTVLLEAAQQAKHLTPLEADQHTGVTDTQATRLNPQQHVKTAELLLAHRQHRHHGAPPGTPEPGEVSPLYCRGVSSLYCAYSGYRRKTLRRHISTRHGLSRDEYLKRWGLRSDHPLIAPAYSERRAAMAKGPGFGRKATAQATPVVSPPAEAPTPRRRPGRPRTARS